MPRVPKLARLSLLLATVTRAVASNEAGRAFLAKNAGLPGVQTLPSGLQYRIIESGSGPEHPLVGTDCTCHYEGRTAQQYPDGKKFDSSFDRGAPTNFAPNQVIAGWTEAMQMMVAGDKWELFLPSELGYGDAGQGPDIGGGDVLVFTLHLLKLNGPGKALTHHEIMVRQNGGKHKGKGRGGGGARGSKQGEL
jgi:FKBP-type peptidyl-prolyl cis-trans isomerase FklB